jgi:hypothetical protein
LAAVITAAKHLAAFSGGYNSRSPHTQSNRRRFPIFFVVQSKRRRFPFFFVVKDTSRIKNLDQTLELIHFISF